MGIRHEELKIVGYVMAANFQAIAIVVGAYKLIEYLESKYLDIMPWKYIVWSLSLLLLVHLFYVIFVQILKMERERKK